MQVEVTKKLYICDGSWCDRLHLEHDSQKEYKVIHIWRSDIPDNSCKYVKDKNFISDNKNNYFFNYRDGYELSLDQLKGLYDFIIGERKTIYVHCHAGKTRSPTIALFVLAKQLQLNPLSVIDTIYTTYYQQTKQVPNLTMLPIEGIMLEYEKS